jgi:hypothetical protein
LVTAIVPAEPAFVYPLLPGGCTVPDAKDDSFDAEDREEWDHSWSAMPHRRLSSPPKTGIPDDLLSGWGDPVSFTISQDPPAFSDRMW